MKSKNPKAAPITIHPKIVVSLISQTIEITVKQVSIIVVTLVANPSIPSVKFTAFVVANITITANGIYNHSGRVIY